MALRSFFLPQALLVIVAFTAPVALGAPLTSSEAPTLKESKKGKEAETSSEAPTLKEWKKGKEAEKAAAEAKVAEQKKRAAVDKTIAMLEDLKLQVLSEGEAEAETYDKFACFCKDTTTDKTAAIESGVDKKDALTAEIGSLSQKRGEIDQNIAALIQDIATSTEKMKQATAEHQAYLKDYNKNAADLKAAQDALEGATRELKASYKPSFAQLQAVGKTVRTAVLLADALGLDGSKKASVASLFLQQPDVPMEDYKFHSDQIIETLEKLEKDFLEEQKTVDAAKVSTVAEHDSLIQEETLFVKRKNKELAEAKALKSQTVEEIGQASQRLTTTAAMLLDDQEYLKELARICADKATTWDQRSKVRADELTTLTQVIGIIKSAVSSNTTAATVRFVQQGVSVRIAQAVAGNEAAMDAIEASAEDAEATQPLAFVQRLRVQKAAPAGRKPSSGFLALAQRHRGAGAEAAVPASGNGKEEVVALLRSKGKELKSTLLTALATQISADPFAKVKKLIQELIERLLQEAGNEANQKGWCDKSISDNEQQRDYAAEEIDMLNSQLAKTEALRDALSEELSVLESEIGELESNRAKANSTRLEESAENANTVKEAEEGLVALEEAIDILSKFYMTVAKETVDLALAQQSPAADAPDAGFNNGQAYLGAQSESGGILGMLDVMKSDFKRTITETNEAEAQAEADFLAFMTETGKSLAAKEEASAAKTTQKDAALEKITADTESLDSETGKLKFALKELLGLKPVCIDTGMSYADRVSRREEEIEALKKGLCILHNYQSYGAAGAAAEC